MMNEYPCRKCGHMVQERQKQCSWCGARQPKYGFYIDNGSNRPMNGFSMIGFGMGLGCWAFAIVGILIAAAGVVFCIIGLVLARLRGQSGTLFSFLLFCMGRKGPWVLKKINPRSDMERGLSVSEKFEGPDVVSEEPVEEAMEYGVSKPGDKIE